MVQVRPHVKVSRPELDAAGLNLPHQGRSTYKPRRKVYGSSVFIQGCKSQPNLLSCGWVDDIIVSAPTGDSSRRSILSKGLQDRFHHGIKITDDSTKVFHLLGCVLEWPFPKIIWIHQNRFLISFSGRLALKMGEQARMFLCLPLSVCRRKIAKNVFKVTWTTDGPDLPLCL